MVDEKMRNKRKFVYAIISFALVILFSWFVMSIITSSGFMKVTSPASFTNNSGTITFNVTYSNISADIIDPRNVTFYYNLSANWASIQNSSAFVLNGSCFGASKACFVTLLNGGGGYNLSDGTYTINASLDNGTDQVSVNFTGNISVNVIIDNTPPIVFNGNITNPVTETNYSGNLLLNVSVVDALATVRAVAFNITNATSDQTNGTAYANAIRIATQIGVIFFNFTINTAQFPDGLYNISILANDTTTSGNVNNTARIKLIRFDNTRPQTFNQNISLPASGTNHTGTKVFNASLVDALTGIQTAYFNITNGTGTQNATYTATREGTTTYYSVSVSTTGFKDGNYTVTMWVNDTAGNQNNSAQTTSIFFDNTAPTVSVSCTPNPVSAGTTITCTCSRSDATSGVNTVSFNANPSTASTGTFTSSCTVTDFAGNSGTGSTTYTVEQGSSGATSSSASSGGGGGASAGEPVEEKTTRFAAIVPETPSVMAFRNDADDFGVDEIVIAVTETASNVRVTAKTYNDNTPTGVSAKDGKVFKYLEVITENLAAKLSEATIKAQVPKSWVESNLGGDTSDVAVFKFVNNGWTQLPTTYTGEEGDNYNYDARTTSFSFFVIGEKVVEPVVEPVVEEEQPQLQPAETPAPAPEKNLNMTWIIVGIIVVIIVVILIWWFVSRREK